jgi:glycosyltransferase involved in cell wall biosynthesis
VGWRCTRTCWRHLIARGHAVTLFAASGSDPSLGLRAVCPPTGTPAEVLARERTALEEHRAYAAIVEEIAQGGFNLVHNNSLHYLPLTEAARMPVPMVTSFHCPPFMELENGVVERSCQDLRFVAVSDVVGMWRHLVPVDTVIANGIDLDLFQPRTEPPPAPHAIWSGRLVPEKGAHLAIAAARRAGMPLRIAGPMNDAAY